MNTYEKLTLALQALVAVAAFATLAFLIKQVRVMVEQIVATQEATRAQSALALANFLQSPEVREARHRVRADLSSKHHSQWTEDEKRYAVGPAKFISRPPVTKNRVPTAPRAFG